MAWLEPRRSERLKHLVSRGLEGIDANVDRRALGHRPALDHEPVSEGPRKGRHQPLRHIRLDVLGRILGHAGFETAALFSGDGLRCMPRTVGGSHDLVDGKIECAWRCGQHERPRRVAMHLSGKRRPPPQNVIHQRADGRTVAGACEAVRASPIGKCRRGRAVPADDLLQHLCCGFQTPAKPHLRGPLREEMRGDDACREVAPHAEKREHAEPEEHGSAEAHCCAWCGSTRAKGGGTRRPTRARAARYRRGS